MKLTRQKILMEEILTLLMYGVDLLSLSGFRKWDQSYEGWLYSNGLLSRMHYLEKQKFLLREGKKSEWVYRLTAKGRALALGGRDPEQMWQRPWDGWWRQIIFDLPVGQEKARARLIRWLRSHGFGYLQDSVWISPDPVTEIAAAVKGFSDNAEAFTILECHCAPGFSNDTLVSGAWPFDRINDRYDAYQKVAERTAKRIRGERLHPRELFVLMREERHAWLSGFEVDPLLPMTLWPGKYKGRRAWMARREVLQALKAQIT